MENEQKIDWLSAAQLIFSSLVVLFSLLGSGLGFVMISLNELITGFSLPAAQITASYLLLGGIAFIGLLLIPSVLESGRKLMGRAPKPQLPLSLRQLNLALVLIAAGILLVSTGSIQGGLPFILIHVFANGVFAVWMIQLVQKGLEIGSRQRFWGVFGSGLALAPALALIAEILLLILVGLVWFAYLQSRPDLLQEISQLVNRLPQSAVNPAILERVAGKYLIQPGVMGTILVYLAVMIPLVEELVKPIGVWLLLRRNLTAWEGFFLGALSGAGYALFENLTIGANAEVWTVVLISRIGTTAVHMLTSGMVGWGMTAAWSGKRILRLGYAFLAAVILHGVWNGLNVINLLTAVPDLETTLGTFPALYAAYAPVGLVILGLGSLFGLIRANSYFQRAIIAQNTTIK